MKLTGLHLLVTYQCTFECDHCFAWGSPRQTGVMTLKDLRNVFQQAAGLGTVEWIYFEGGEPFLYYATTVKAIQEAHAMGFQVGVVSNTYWATSLEDARASLQPLAGLVDDLTISSDLFHYGELHSQQTSHAEQAARELGIPLGVICVAQPKISDAASSFGKIADGESAVMFRGRAVEKLAPQAPKAAWKQFAACPHEDLREPDRLHLDPFGNLHICQGILIGNLFREPLGEICVRYNPQEHPITSALLSGGPAELVQRYDLPHQEAYADACHLCYEARRALRSRFPEILAPDQMYGVF